jgi:PKD repeat protein
LTKTVTVDPLPTADFTSNTICEPGTTQLTDLSNISSGVINGWNWNFGNGQTSTSQNPTITFPNQGTYNVSLVINSSSGCKDSIVRTVTVKPTPKALFSALDVCDGDSVKFINASTIDNGFISDVAWDFGDGNTSSLNDPSHLYAAAGTYLVTLTVGSDLGCQHSVSQPVNVNARPVANFTSNAVCNGGATIFNDQSTVAGGSITGWYWDFGNGSSTSQASPTYTYSSDSVYTVTLVATSDKGCTGTLSKTTNVYALPQAGFTTSNVCLGSQTQFTDTSKSSGSSIAAWSWNFGDGQVSNSQNPNHSYSVEGSYSVQLIVSTLNGCTDTINQNVNVFPIPKANFFSGNVCNQTQSEFFDQSSINGGSPFSYNWSFGDNTIDTVSNPIHTYALAGNYTVDLTIITPYGCSDTKSKTVTIYPKPTPLFTVADVCLHQNALFQDASNVGGGTITGWNWNLGDSTITSAQSPTHFYNAPGTYQVSLLVTTDNGCRAQYNDSITINTLPTPGPLTGNGCVNDNIAFADTSTGANNNITSWNWNFGSGATSNLQNTTYSFNAAGVMQVSLTTTNANGCSATATVSVTVNPLPVAGFNAGSTCANSGLQFNNTSTIPSGNISNYLWDFGDSSATSTATNPIHNYTTSGTYTVTLIAYSAEGCTDTITGQVLVNPLPVPNFSNPPIAACGPFPVQFTDSSYVPNGNIVSWFWDFGDGQSSTQQNPVHIYTTAGSYAVSLTVSSDSGCTATIIRPSFVTVYPGPQADFEPDPYKQTILSPNFSFNNLSTGGVSYQWTFGDGTGSTLFSPTHSYRDTGTYVVILWVTNAFGCMDSISRTVRVDPEF